ncbi:uncharacterized protein si:dkey-237j10.2 [Syngnathoides biaculeatus]|uniref:uncharacterized protein si:dkey-237j10.2 n=1 Tax=Syngnathoides biaculeatus TaxID=300417 RepID=UPI002ADE0F03|nr:uncharacterized protein si:dkey-237j10.2 [Syngnathoides biaculeatus]
MLGEGFLTVLTYKEEVTSDSMGDKLHTRSSSPQTDLQQRGVDLEKTGCTLSNGSCEVPAAPPGLFISRCSPAQTLEMDLTLGSGPCSLLEHYPDLQVADSGPISYNPSRPTATLQDLYTHSCALTLSERAEQQQFLHEHLLSLPDQGYLVMGDSVNTSLGLHTSQLEPMSNSLLNGLLEKKLDEVYLQHLTDNLARCSSNLGNSLLHGLVSPLQANNLQQDSDSLESSLEKGPGGERGKKISQVTTPNLAPCSSNFSTPILRISEDTCSE